MSHIPCHIALTNHASSILLDAADYPRMAQHRWMYAKPPHARAYACRTDGGRTVLFHRDLAQVAADEGVWFHNNNQLDCRRDNWVILRLSDIRRRLRTRTPDVMHYGDSVTPKHAITDYQYAYLESLTWWVQPEPINEARRRGAGESDDANPRKWMSEYTLGTTENERIALLDLAVLIQRLGPHERRAIVKEANGYMGHGGDPYVLRKAADRLRAMGWDG